MDSDDPRSPDYIPDLNELDLTPEERERLTDTQRPLWEIIAASLRADILDGRYTPGAPLPSEPALAARYSVSRPTVRDAVKALVGEGLVTVVRGRGTFVRAVPDRYVIRIGDDPRHDIAEHDFTSTARQWGWKGLPLPHEHEEPDEYNGYTDREVYHLTGYATATRDIAAALGLRTGHTVFRRHSRWHHPITGLVIEVSSYTIPELMPDPTAQPTLAQALARQPFYDVITEGRGPITWETTTTARMPYADERELMALSVGSPILIIRRTMLDKDGRPLEMTELKADAERFETAHTRENLAPIPEGADPAEYAKYLQTEAERPNPQPTGRTLFLL